MGRYQAPYFDLNTLGFSGSYTAEGGTRGRGEEKEGDDKKQDRSRRYSDRCHGGPAVERNPVRVCALSPGVDPQLLWHAGQFHHVNRSCQDRLDRTVRGEGRGGEGSFVNTTEGDALSVTQVTLVE